MIEASDTLAANSAATCGSNGSATRIVAADTKAPADNSAIARTRDGDRSEAAGMCYVLKGRLSRTGPKQARATILWP